MPSPATQYTATSFAQPIRRVFGTVVFRAREHVEMPPPGDTRPARLTVELHDPIWDALYAPLAAAHRRRRRPAQPPAVPDHPPISEPRVRRARHSAAGARGMVLIRDSRHSGRADAAGAGAGAAAHRLRAQGEGAAAAPAGPAADPALSRSRAADAQGGGAGGERLLAVPRHSLSGLRRHLGRGVAGADLPHRPAVLAGRPISSPSSRSSAARASSWRSPAWMSARASAASARAAR